MFKRWIILGLGLVTLAGCNTESVSYQTEQTYVREAYQADTDSKVEQAQTGQATTDSQALIYTANVDLQTITYEETKAALLAAIENGAAQVQYQDEYTQTYYDYRTSSQSDERLYTLSMTLRIPQDDFEPFLAELTSGELAELLSTSRGVQDVTMSVRDLDIRVASINGRVERLNDLLDEAKNIADIIEIQNSLDAALIERDQLLAEQKNLNDQVSRSTITVTLREVLELEDGVSQRSFWDELVRALAQTGYRAIDVLQQGILSLVFLLPYLLFLVILFLIYRFIIKPILKAVGFTRLFKWKNKKNAVKKESQTNDKLD